MSDDYEKHHLALQRQENADRLARQRSQESDARRDQRSRDAEDRKSRRQTEAQLGELDAMNLKHELDIENRNLDHQADMLNDNREVVRLKAELELKRKDDFVRDTWEQNRGLQDLEGKIVEKIADAKISKKAAETAHGHNIEASALDHKYGKEKAVLDNELAKDKFEFEERLRAEIARENRQFSEADIQASLDRLKKDGKL